MREAIAVNQAAYLRRHRWLTSVDAVPLALRILGYYLPGFPNMKRRSMQPGESSSLGSRAPQRPLVTHMISRFCFDFSFRIEDAFGALITRPISPLFNWRIPSRISRPTFLLSLAIINLPFDLDGVLLPFLQRQAFYL